MTCRAGAGTTWRPLPGPQEAPPPHHWHEGGGVLDVRLVDRSLADGCCAEGQLAPSSGGTGRRGEEAAPRSEKGEGGYFAVGVVGLKTEPNLGTLWRSAWQLGAAYIFTVGARFTKQSTDTYQTWTRLPCFEHKDWGAFCQASPYAAPWVAVEMGGTPLEDFVHPQRAVYVLGSEDTGLPESVVRACAMHVSLPCVRDPSFNVAVAGSLIMYDRVAKHNRRRAATQQQQRQQQQQQQQRVCK
jgi:tRNA(Leu) C34 or U34 (ribose-2'-O)-methylase TrmL